MNNLHPIFEKILQPYMPSCSTGMKRIKIGDILKTKHGTCIITEIEMVEPGQSDGGIPMAEIWECDKDRCVFSLDNGHWAYGYESEIVS